MLNGYMIIRIKHHLKWTVFLIVALLQFNPASAQSARPLAIEGQISEDGDKLGLSWPFEKGAKAEVFRRTLGQRGLTSWQKITPQLLRPWRMLDTSLVAGIPYEYQIRVKGSKGDRVGHWAAGSEVPARSTEGRVLLVVDDTLLDGLGSHLDQFEADLTGAGWHVERHLAPRASKDVKESLAQAYTLRSWIIERVQAHPNQPHSIVLVGHIPIVSTGWVNPDGHDAKGVPSDLYYADTEGYWPRFTNPKGGLQLRPSALPADHINSQIGRVDFALLDPDFGSELSLLQAYFDKNHAWRHARTGDLRNAYGQSGHLKIEQNGLLNIVGAKAVVTGGHHDTSEVGPFLFGVDFGHWKGKEYLSQPPTTSVFAINFGSGKHQFQRGNNPMTALLAARHQTLAVGWGGRPSWQLHGMALGESIGAAHMRTVNNGAASQGGLASREYLSTGNYDWLNPVWVNLLGDPTLKPFPLKPVADLVAAGSEQGALISWSLPEGARDVLVYRAAQQGSPFEILNDGSPVLGTTFLDKSGPEGAWYMVRARGLAKVHAGSFYRLSQGVFVASPR